MPFLGKDWRSNGDEWIRTEHGWERCKALECILDNLSIGLRKEKVSKKQRRFNSSISSCNSRLNSESDEKYSNVNSLELLETTQQEIDSAKDRVDTSCQNDESFINKDFENLNNENDSFDSELDMYIDDFDSSTDEDSNNNFGSGNNERLKKKKNNSLSRLCLSNGSIERYLYKTKQPHIIYHLDGINRENNAPKHSISDVLAALDMPGAVRDIKRFNYVCRLVQIIINEKLHNLSGNGQRTLFMIVKQMLIQVIKSQENLNIMKKLLVDLKKKIQDSYFFYFYYIGSQKLSEKHLATISKWQEMLENPNHKRVKRLTSHHHFFMKQQISQNNILNNEINKENEETNFETIPHDCKIEIMRRLNTGLDLINLSKCNKGFNDIINKELAIWKNLCQFHFHQTNINTFLNKNNKTDDFSNKNGENNSSEQKSQSNDLDWKQIYFKLKRRYGHREVYVDMIHKCLFCKCLFWKEIGHPCIISSNSNNMNENELLLDIRTEPITPKKLIDLLLK